MTLAIVLGAVVVLGVYDGWAYITGHQTISSASRSVSARIALYPFLIGLICGHLFWADSCSEKECREKLNPQVQAEKAK